jgi:transcriptional regulator with XRE-family HTH domain
MASSRRARGPVREDPPGDLSRQIVDEVTWYMRQHKVTRADLAQSMNVSPGRVSQILSGEENLTLRTLGGVLAALGAEVEFTLRPVDDPVDLLDGVEETDDDLTSAAPGAVRRSASARRVPR